MDININVKGLVWLASAGNLNYQTDEDYPDRSYSLVYGTHVTRRIPSLRGKDCQYRVLALDWTPDDVTYKMIFTRLPEGQDANWMVTDVNNGSFMFLVDGKAVDKFQAYEKLVSQKTPVGEDEWWSTAPAQTIIINALLGDLTYAKSLFKDIYSQ